MLRLLLNVTEVTKGGVKKNMSFYPHLEDKARGGLANVDKPEGEGSANVDIFFSS